MMVEKESINLFQGENRLVDHRHQDGVGNEPRRVLRYRYF